MWALVLGAVAAAPIATAHAEDPTPAATADARDRAAAAVRAAKAAREQYVIDGNAAPLRAAITRLEEIQWEMSWADSTPDALASELADELAACQQVSSRPAPAAPPAQHAVGVDVADADLLRATIASDPTIRRRWRRGSALMGAGVPVMIVGGGMLVSGAVFGLVNAFDRDFDGTGLGLFLGGLAAMGGGGAMIGLGVKDRVIAKRDARRRLQVSVVPRKGGAWAGLQLRF